VALLSSESMDEQFKGRWYQFTQQRLRAWQPILSPVAVVALYLVVGVVFIGLGAFLFMSSQAIVELFYDYTELVVDAETRVGFFDIEVTEDMKPPIYVYYQLGQFHQNHRHYVQSRDDLQLRKSDSPSTRPQELAACSPWVSSGDPERVNYPCGLVARSVFNDSYSIVLNDRNAYSQLEVDSSAKAIAWAADTNGRYKNADPEAINANAGVPNQRALNMWLLKRFPPVECVQVDVSPSKPLVPVSVATRTVTLKDGSQSEELDCRDYMSGNPTCNFTRNAKPFTCAGDYQSRVIQDWGLESGHFIVWMRIAGLPTFRKLWGKVNQELKAGSSLRVFVEDNFPARPFHGRKALVLSTGSALGGRNDFLGIGYMVVGSCCLLFGLVFLVAVIMKRQSG
jgi:hypothetical protein